MLLSGEIRKAANSPLLGSAGSGQFPPSFQVVRQKIKTVVSK